MAVEDVERFIAGVTERIASGGAGAGGTDYGRIVSAARVMVEAEDNDRRVDEAIAARRKQAHTSGPEMSRQQRRAAERAARKNAGTR